MSLIIFDVFRHDTPLLSCHFRRRDFLSHFRRIADTLLPPERHFTVSPPSAADSFRCRRRHQATPPCRFRFRRQTLHSMLPRHARMVTRGRERFEVIALFFFVYFS